MNINLEVTLLVNETQVLQKGVFPVNNSRFKENPNKEVALVTSEWIKQLRKKSGFFYEAQIVKVSYDNNEITDIIMESMFFRS
ncbi:hypothetical protein [Peribacillus deserti]|uniref:Uncharacterized protein n=1 Tax=Peribacillus deserti TaxID=673318 RepID=A0A2N5M4H3_9BACI|nr:hypothetical protein [Peribacillus deserti]PLT29268.1 hypothetical protein CUU66_13945 [Peribacillus deserti]